MNLKPDISLSEFFHAVHACQGNVLFETSEGDQLNLKSVLSQYVFAAAIAGQFRALKGRLSCDQADVPHLEPFLLQ